MNHLYLNENNHNRRTSMISIPKNNQIEKENYEYDVMKFIDSERQFMAAQQQLQQNNLINKPQQNPYMPFANGAYHNARDNQNVIPFQSPPVKPLRIVIIRHAERVDAVLGSDWSKKSFDRHGQYIRFNEHLPDALPNRSYMHHYVIDVPLTNRGRMHAFKTGKSLLENGYVVDVCYTSPSLRCVQSADGILAGMGRRGVSMQLEPGLFECYLNDFKRTLCFMTKDELLTNGYNIHRTYKSLMPFMRPHDSQVDYYERCRTLMDSITERHQATGGTILIVAHAPSHEGLTRHLSGGKIQYEKLFDIARRVPFLAMTIIERNNIRSPWLFRTKPLNTGQTDTIRETTLQLASPATPINSIISDGTKPNPNFQQQRIQPNEHQQMRTPVDPRKVVKSSTLPNLPKSNSFTEMFHVI